MNMNTTNNVTYTLLPYALVNIPQYQGSILPTSRRIPDPLLPTVADLVDTFLWNKVGVFLDDGTGLNQADVDTSVSCFFGEKDLTVYLNAPEPTVNAVYAALLTSMCARYGVSLTLMHCVKDLDDDGYLDASCYMEQKVF